PRRRCGRRARKTGARQRWSGECATDSHRAMPRLISSPTLKVPVTPAFLARDWTGLLNLPSPLAGTPVLATVSGKEALMLAAIAALAVVIGSVPVTPAPVPEPPTGPHVLAVE